MALHKPILESAAKILEAKGDHSSSMYFCRRWAADHQGDARRLITTAAREVDFLREIGELEPPRVTTPTGTGKRLDGQDADTFLLIRRALAIHALRALISAYASEFEDPDATLSDHLIAKGLIIELDELNASDELPGQRDSLSAAIPLLLDQTLHQLDELLAREAKANG